MSTLLIVFIVAAGIAGLIVFFVRTRIILSQRLVLSKRMSRVKATGNMISIISADKKLFSLTRSFATPKEVIHYGMTIRQIRAAGEYVGGLEEASLQISTINNTNIKNELGLLQISIHKHIDSDKFVGKFLTSKQVDLLTTLRSESNTIESLTNSAEKIHLREQYIRAICLLEKVKHINAFK